MKKDRIEYLLDKYRSDRLEKTEWDELAQMMKSEDDTALLAAMQKMQIVDEWKTPDFDPEKKQEILNRILSVDKPVFEEELMEEQVEKGWRPGYKWLAAASAALLMVSLGVSFYLKQIRPDQASEWASAGPASGVAVNFVRNLTLPDGSSVVLQAGSTLNYPAAFNEGIREVWLVGEAYFDVKRAANRPESTPFVIHSGKLTTTVLGTSFNIKAYPGDSEIVVSVTRGKVRVENDKEVLGILTPDDKLTYSVERSKSVLLHADVNPSIEWVKNDVSFDGVAFGKIAELLEKRFGVKIHFKNDPLKSCVIVSSFDGTETIQNVLETLCSISNSSYKMLDDNEILIEGEGCKSIPPIDQKR